MFVAGAGGGCQVRHVECCARSIIAPFCVGPLPVTTNFFFVWHMQWRSMAARTHAHARLHRSQLNSCRHIHAQTTVYYTVLLGVR